MTLTIVDEPTVIVDGVQHCACISELSDDDQRFVIAVGKMLPTGVWVDAHVFDYGRRLVVRAVLGEHRFALKVERAEQNTHAAARIIRDGLGVTA